MLVKSMVLMVLALSGLGGCVTEQRSEAVSVFDQVNPTKLYHYGFTEQPSERWQVILKMALGYWRRNLPEFPVSYSNPGDPLDVKISVQSLSNSLTPSHTKLIGCMDYYAVVFDCEIHLKVPSLELLSRHRHQLQHLIKKGPLDRALIQTFVYQPGDGMIKLQDKLILLTLIHEIGHTLGLSHTDEALSQCIMAPYPDGDATLCLNERQMIRSKLLQSLSDRN